jgi:hypothetical protein
MPGREETYTLGKVDAWPRRNIGLAKLMAEKKHRLYKVFGREKT